MVEYSRYLQCIETALTQTGYVWMNIDVDLACKASGGDLVIAMDIVG